MTQQEYFEKKSQREQQAIDWFTTAKKEQGEFVLNTRTDGQFDSFDFWIYSGETEMLAETKVREDITGAQAIKWGGPIFEFKKLSGMVEYKEKYGHNNPIYYFNFFKDGLYIYEISDDPTMYTWQSKKLPKNSYDKQMVWKCVTFLQPNNLVEIIKYK